MCISQGQRQKRLSNCLGSAFANRVYNNKRYYWWRSNNLWSWEQLPSARPNHQPVQQEGHTKTNVVKEKCERKPDC